MSTHCVPHRVMGATQLPLPPEPAELPPAPELSPEPAELPPEPSSSGGLDTCPALQPATHTPATHARVIDARALFMGVTPLLYESFGKEAQIDGVRHLLISGGGQVQAVTAIVGGYQLGRRRSVTDRGIQVDEAVENAAA